MGIYKTKTCFFTGKNVISCEEIDGKSLDGYYYSIRFNDKIREVRLNENYNWKNDIWVNKYGQSFFDLLDTFNKWNFFDKARDIREIQEIYSELQSS